MPELPAAMAQLGEVTRSPQATTDLIEQAVLAVQQTIATANVEQLNQSLSLANELLADEKVHRYVTQRVAQLSHAMVEAGGDPLLTGWTLLLLLGESLTGSQQYCQIVLTDAVQAERVKPNEEGEILMTHELAQLYLQALMQHDPYIAWLFYNWPIYSTASIAHLVRASELRTKHPANTQLLLDASRKLDGLFGSPDSPLTMALAGEELDGG